MSAALKLENINTHVVDILGSIKGRDHPIMKIDRAIELVKCLDQKILASDDYVFFDPFCKAGEILLATALLSTLHRKDKIVISLDKVIKEIYQNNRFFALATDKRHYYLSLRTFYGNEKSHNNNFTKNIRNGGYLSEIDGRLDKVKFKRELNSMLEYIKGQSKDKKIIVIGNPPYQEEDSGHGRSSKPIYNILIELLIETGCINQLVLVIPSRWFSGGKGLDGFRKKIIKSGRVKSIRYFENPHYIFPTVEIRGGICFLYWEDKVHKKTYISNNSTTKEVDLSSYDIIVPHIQAYSILKKVIHKSNLFIDSIIWPRKPFGLEGNYFKKKEYIKGPIECFCEGKEIKKISRDIISKNFDKIDMYKVAFPEASGGGKGKRDKILPRPEHFFILKPGQISTETYSIANSFRSLEEAEGFMSFLRTYFSRFLLGLRKPTQHTSRKTFAWVPLMEIDTVWTDEKLFKHFKINKKEERYIKDKVDYWTS